MALKLYLNVYFKFFLAITATTFIWHFTNSCFRQYFYGFFVTKWAYHPQCAVRKRLLQCLPVPYFGRIHVLTEIIAHTRINSPSVERVCRVLCKTPYTKHSTFSMKIFYMFCIPSQLRHIHDFTDHAKWEM